MNIFLKLGTIREPEDEWTPTIDLLFVDAGRGNHFLTTKTAVVFV